MRRGISLLALCSLIGCHHEYPPRPLDQALVVDQSILDQSPLDQAGSAERPDGALVDVNPLADRGPDLPGACVLPEWRSADGRMVVCKAATPPPLTYCVAKDLLCLSPWHLCSKVEFLKAAFAHASPPPKETQHAWISACVISGTGVSDTGCKLTSCCSGCQAIGSANVVYDCSGGLVGALDYPQVGVVTDGDCHQLGAKKEPANWRAQHLDGTAIDPHGGAVFQAFRGLCCF